MKRPLQTVTVMVTVSPYTPKTITVHVVRPDVDLTEKKLSVRLAPPATLLLRRKNLLKEGAKP